MLPLALLLPPPIARNLLSAPQVRLLAKPIPQACAGCAALTPAPRSRPLAVTSHNAQASARTELQLPSTRTISCCSRRCRPACPCKCPGLSHQGATHSPLLFPSPPLTLFAVGLPASCSIAPARRTSAAAWEITATWHVCNGYLGMVPPPSAAVPPPAFLGPNPCPASNSCALLRAAAAAAASAPSRAIRRAAERPPPLPRPALRHRPQASRERRYRRRQPAAHRNHVRHQLAAAAGHSPRPRPPPFPPAPHAASSAGGCRHTAGGGHQQHAAAAVALHHHRSGAFTPNPHHALLSTFVALQVECAPMLTSSDNSTRAASAAHHQRISRRFPSRVAALSPLLALLSPRSK